MIKKTITYVDFDGHERTEDFYFNLTKAELAELELSTEGGLQKRIEGLIQSQNGGEIIKLFKEIINMAYGVKSPDGRKFQKGPEILADFTQTEAYSTLFMELATNADAASAFINGIVPKVAELPKG